MSQTASALRILVLSSYMVCPPRSGGAIRMVSPLLALGALRPLGLTFLYQCHDAVDTPAVDDYFAAFPWVRAIGVPNQNHVDTLRDSHASTLPPDVLSQMDLAYCERLRALLREEEFDVVQVEHSQMAWVVPFVRELQPQARVLLDLHNVEHLILERWRHLARDQAAYLDALYGKMLAWERLVWPWFDACLAISPPEAELYRAQSSAPVYYLPPSAGIPLERFPWPAPEPPVADTVVYVGTMDWFANAHGLAWFLDEVWPLVLGRRPQARLLLAGHGRTLPLLAASLARAANVEYLGEVEDERQLLWSGAAFVVPLWIGAGARLKILTAWAAGTPVVATSIGAEGLGGRDGVHLLLADEPATFADAICRLLEGGPSEALRRDARRLIDEQFSLQELLRRQLAAYDEVLRTPGRATEADEAQWSHYAAAWLELMRVKSDLFLARWARERELTTELVETTAQLRVLTVSLPYRAWLRLRGLLPKPLRRALGSPF